MVQTTCGKQCHGIDVVTSYQLSRTGWQTMVGAMVARGAIVPDENVDVVVDYLSTYFGR